MSTSLRYLNALRAFEAAAKHSNFAKAAQDLNVSHSVVSQHVKNLELWLGTELFKRYGNRIELSEDGRILAPQISSGFQTLRDACDNMLRVSQYGTITVSAEPAIASRWLRKRISEFCNSFPKIEVDLKPAWRPPMLGEGHADIVIHFETRMPAKGVTKTKLFPIDAFPACSPKLSEQVTISGGIADFSHLPLIHDNGREIWHQWYTEFLPGCADWESGRVYSDLSLAIDAAVDGEGIILADKIICHRELATGALVKLDERQIRCVWYSLAVNRDTRTNSPVKLFENWLLETTKEDVSTSIFA